VLYYVADNLAEVGGSLMLFAKGNRRKGTLLYLAGCALLVALDAVCEHTESPAASNPTTEGPNFLTDFLSGLQKVAAQAETHYTNETPAADIPGRVPTEKSRSARRFSAE
jgi:hypothetical protein